MAYRIRQNKNDWRRLEPVETYDKVEYLESHSDMWLTTEFHEANDGKTHQYYRLHTRQPHSIEMALAYNLKCPKCGSYMKQVTRCLNSHDLGLYTCPECDRRKNRR